jgi:hypothetical protein
VDEYRFSGYCTEDRIKGEFRDPKHESYNLSGLKKQSDDVVGKYYAKDLLTWQANRAII